MRLHVITCIVSLAAWAAGVGGERVLRCEANSNPRLGAGARTQDIQFTDSHDFTACIRFQFLRLQRMNIVFRVLTNGTRPLLQLELNVEKLRVAVSFQYKFVLLERWLRPYRWYFVCVAFDLAHTQVTVWLDGQLLQTHNLTQIQAVRATELTVGYVDPLNYPGISFIGDVTQFNIWNRILSEEEVRDLAQCRIVLQGDVISWKQEWEVQNVQEYEVDVWDLCPHRKPRRFQVFPPMSYKENVYMCDALGGFVPIPKNFSDVTAILSGALEARSGCQQMWLNIQDEAQEGVWYHHNSGRLVQDVPWAIDEPNGLHYENCGGIEAEGVVDADCLSPRCLCCAVEHDLILTMRGSCERLVHDMNYMMSFDNDERVFMGYGDYKILHNGTHWIWFNHQLNETVAYLLPSSGNYPMGRHLWYLKLPVCDQKSGETRRLLLSVCDEGEYTCDDGTCVTLDQRCDLKYDCRDKTDEADCLLVRLPPDYKTSVAPRLPQRRGGYEALEVGCMVTLGNLRVDTPEMLLKVAFNLTLVWQEPRATYVNLKDDARLNPVEGSVREVWRPSVVLLNTVDATPVTAPTHTYVLRHGPHTSSDNSVPEEVRLYRGRDNPLVEERKYQASFTCDFDLARYPFDEQTCFLAFQFTAGSSDYLRWSSPGSWVGYTGSTLLMEYTVGPVTLLHTPSVLKVRVPLARRDGYAVISIYVPSLTMLVIGYLTLFFVRDNFEVRVMTSLTSLLVMATLFTQVAASLPKTSYFKLVDIWLLFCIFSTFCIIVFHIIIDLLLKEVKRQSFTTTARSSEKKTPLPEKIFLPRIGRDHLHPHQQQQQQQQQQPPQEDQYPWQLQKPLQRQKPTLRKSARGQILGEMAEYLTISHKSRDILSCRQKVLMMRQCKFGLTLRMAEKFAKFFMMVVFLIFNIVYWMIAYAA